MAPSSVETLSFIDASESLYSEGDFHDVERSAVVKKVRGCMKLLSSAGKTQIDDPKERALAASETWKKIFKECESDGSGLLYPRDIIRMARIYFKMSELAVSDEELFIFFNELDLDGNGSIDFGEWIDFINVADPPDPEMVETRELGKLRQGIRMAVRRLRLSVEQLEDKLRSSIEDGIAVVTAGRLALSGEGFVRFLRKILRITVGDMSDKCLGGIYRMLDKDHVGHIFVEQMMQIVDEAVREEPRVCPSTQGVLMRIPQLAGVTRSDLPVRSRRKEVAGATFRLCGRDSEPTTRLGTSETPAFMRHSSSVKRSAGALLLTSSGSSLDSGWSPSRSGRLASASRASLRSAGSLGASLGLSSPSSGSFPASPSMSPRPSGRQPLPQAAAPGAGGSAARPHTVSCAPRSGLFADGEDRGGFGRGSYVPCSGIVSGKEARMLNRLERQLFVAGVDVRGQYLKSERIA